MSIIDIIDKSLKSNILLEVVKEYKHTFPPLELGKDNAIKEFNKNNTFDKYIDTATYYVAPKNKLKDINGLQEFMYKIIPENTIPTTIINFRFDENRKQDSHGILVINKEYAPKKIIFGKIQYIEHVGMIVENTSRIIHDEDLLKKFDEKKEHTIINKVYRKVVINPFPSINTILELNESYGVIKTIESILDTHSEYDYVIAIDDLKRLK